MYPTFLRLQLVNLAAALFLPVPYTLVNPACDFSLFPGAPTGLPPQLASTTKTFPTCFLLRPGTSNFLELQNNSSYHYQTVPSVRWDILYASSYKRHPPAVFFSERFLTKCPLKPSALSRPEENT